MVALIASASVSVAAAPSKSALVSIGVGLSPDASPKIRKTPGLFRLGVLLWLFVNYALYAPASLAAASAKELSASAQDCPADSQYGPVYAGQLLKVVDGDTLRIRSAAHGVMNIRVLGLNTPELGRDGRPDQPLAKAAAKRLRTLLGPAASQHPLYWQLGSEAKDRHGRWLASVFTRPDSGNIAAALVAEGLAWPVVVSPNTAYADCLFALARDAERQQLGVWRAYPVRRAADLREGEGGFMQLRGRVSKRSESRHHIWLELDDRLALKIRKEHMADFKAKAKSPKVGQTWVVQGWLAYRGKSATRRGFQPFVMAVDHPYMLWRREG